MSDTPHPNLIFFFGHFHPLLVHLPIGFLTLLAVLELATRVRHFKHAAEARGVVLFLTAISAIFTAICGLMLAKEGGYEADLLAWHKWMGIALASLCTITAVLFWTKRYRLYLPSLLITLLLLGPASHFGGTITHGEGYLTEYAPAWIHNLFNPATADTALGEKETPTTEKSKPDPAHAPIYAAVIQPIFAQNCVSCHNADKLKGQLRLDSVAAMKQGGKSGPAILAADPDTSPIIQRVELPVADQKHMPPSGKTPLSEEDLAILKWWIEAGAPSEKSFADLEPPLKVADAISAKLGLPPAPPTDPLPLADLRPQMEALSSKLGVNIEPLAADQVGLAVNASIHRSFTDADLAQLAPLSRNIVSLNLAFTKITDIGLATVAGMPNLSRLRLEQTAITDAGLRNLSRLRHLDYLNLYGTSITPAGLQALRGLPSLHHLFLWRTSVPTTAAAQFADEMTDHAKIARLHEEIAALQNQISSQTVEVVGGIPTSMPATNPTTKPTTKPATKPTTKASPKPTTKPAKK